MGTPQLDIDDSDCDEMRATYCDDLQFLKGKELLSQ